MLNQPPDDRLHPPPNAYLGTSMHTGAPKSLETSHDASGESGQILTPNGPMQRYSAPALCDVRGPTPPGFMVLPPPPQMVPMPGHSAPPAPLPPGMSSTYPPYMFVPQSLQPMMVIPMYPTMAPPMQSSAPMPMTGPVMRRHMSAPITANPNPMDMPSYVLEKRGRGRPRKYPPSASTPWTAPPRKGPYDTPPRRSKLKRPKQFLTPWQIYFTEELHKLKEVNPDVTLNVAHFSHEAGKRYAALSEEERAPYIERSQALKKEYQVKLEEWKSNLTPEDIREENVFRAMQRRLGKSRRANMKDPNAPKRPSSAYFIFLRELRNNPALAEEVLHGEQDATKISVLAAAKWREYTEDTKRPYIEKANQERAEYDKQMRAYSEMKKGGHDGDHTHPCGDASHTLSVPTLPSHPNSYP